MELIEMIDDCICELNNEPVYDDCKECPYVYDCWELKEDEEIKMTDFDKFLELCERNNMEYRVIPAYDEKNKSHPCVWLDVGHVEFDDNGKITNIVNY